MHPTRRLIITLVVTAMALMVAAPSALATNPHFLRSSASGPDGNGILTVNFKIAGLGDNESLDVTATADATAIWACRNNGGNWPQAANKQEVRGPVTNTGTFTSGRNGQITGSLPLFPPAPDQLACQGNQTAVLARVSYTDVEVSGGGDAAQISGTFARTLEPRCRCL